MLWVLFVLYIMQPDLAKEAYQVKMAGQYYATVKECNEAGKALVAKLEDDQHVVKIVAGACLPSDKERS